MALSSISALHEDQERPKKKIVPTSKISGLREEFKKTFLPLLIDVFELRQMMASHRSSAKSHLPFDIHAPRKSPREILCRLEELQKEIEESQRWCEGVVHQISKGIEETKEALQFIENSPEIASRQSEEKGKGFWAHLLSTITRIHRR